MGLLTRLPDGDMRRPDIEDLLVPGWAVHRDRDRLSVDTLVRSGHIYAFAESQVQVAGTLRLCSVVDAPAPAIEGVPTRIPLPASRGGPSEPCRVGGLRKDLGGLRS